MVLGKSILITIFPGLHNIAGSLPVQYFPTSTMYGLLSDYWFFHYNESVAILSMLSLTGILMRVCKTEVDQKTKVDQKNSDQFPKEFTFIAFALLSHCFRKSLE